MKTSNTTAPSSQAVSLAQPACAARPERSRSANAATRHAGVDVIEHGPQRSAERANGWSDLVRGVNRNLGDTEVALHAFYERHRELGGRPPKDGSPLAARLQRFHLWADAKMFARSADPAETHWTHDDSRAVVVSSADRFVARTIAATQSADSSRPERAPAPSGLDLRALARDVAQNRYNATIDRSLTARPTAGIDARVLKALLMQESGLDPGVGTNAAGYTGIAQLGRDLATLAQANDPSTAIPLAAKALQEKARYLDTHQFAAFGQPACADDRTRFIVGAYNAGQGTIGDAIDGAYAKAAHRNGSTARDGAARTALRWQSLLDPAADPARSSLYRAIPASWGKAAKYVEIGSYATDIARRARQ